MSCTHEGTMRLVTFEGDDNVVCCDCGVELHDRRIQ
jgi:hypothetical protein